MCVCGVKTNTWVESFRLRPRLFMNFTIRKQKIRTLSVHFTICMYIDALEYDKVVLLSQEVECYLCRVLCSLHLATT